MIPKILHQVWLGGKPLPDNFRVLQQKILKFHPEWTYMLWNEDLIQKENLCNKQQYEHSTFAGQSNLIRLYALRKYGGIYLDMDFNILLPFDELINCSAFVAKQPDGVYCNAFLGSEANNKWIIDMIDNYGNQRVKDAAWGCHIIKEYMNSNVTEYPTEYFYPYNWNESPKPPTEHTYAIHLWEGSWLNK